MSANHHEHDLDRAPLRERMSMPRRRGGLSGTLLLLAGAWGALIPFVGPYFDWVVGPDEAWDMTSGRFWLSLVPGLAVVAGALLLAGTANRPSAALGAWLALAGGAWFAVGPTASRLWNGGDSLAGEPLGGPTRQALETLTYFEGLGALVVALAAFALGRVTTRSVGDALAAREQREDGSRDPDVRDGDPDVRDGDPDVRDGDPDVRDGDPDAAEGKDAGRFHRRTRETQPS